MSVMISPVSLGVPKDCARSWSKPWDPRDLRIETVRRHGFEVLASVSANVLPPLFFRPLAKNLGKRY
jgi:hypothetical protein